MATERCVYCHRDHEVRTEIVGSLAYKTCPAVVRRAGVLLNVMVVPEPKHPEPLTG